MPPSNKPSGQFLRKTVTAGRSRAPVTDLKAARKLQPVDTASDSSDTRIATTSGSRVNGKYKAVRILTTPDFLMHPLLQTRTLAAATVDQLTAVVRNRATFDVQDDATDSDDTATHVWPSKNRVQQSVGITVHSQASQAPPISGQLKRGSTSKAPKSRGTSLDQSDTIECKLRRSSVPSLRMLKARNWKEQKDRRSARMSRMSIGSAGQRQPIQSANAPQQDRRRRWLCRNGRIGTRMRHRFSNDGNDSESENHESEEGSPQPEPPPANVAGAAPKLASQAARKRVVPVPESESDHESESDTNDPFQDSDNILDEPANEDTINQSEKEEEDVLIPSKPSRALLDRLEWLSLNEARLHRLRRLPFLRRNLRIGFRLRCHRAGVDTKPQPLPRASVSVVFGCLIGSEAVSHSDEARAIAKSTMKDWLCPLCDLYHRLDSQKMLDYHLAWDHPSVRVEWDQHTTLSLTIPNSQPEYNPVITRTRQVPYREPSSASELSSDPKPVDKGKNIDHSKQLPVRTSSTPSSSMRGSSSTSFSAVRSSVAEDFKPKFDMSGDSNVGTGTLTRDSSVSGRSASQALSSVDAPPREGLGPSLTSPYLPESVDDGSEVYYSCRPGGPRLYDFLNTLSMEPYGVLKWVILDREEELFELDDVLDEDKVMQALWFRWIFLHRRRFIANYFDGTKTFLRENWELIKKGAGLLALRTWLLVLLVNNFLLPTEVATLMRYYQELAGIQLPRSRLS